MPARFLTSLILCLSALSVFGQELPRVLNFTKSIYAAQSQNWAIAQANDGTLFFANNGGLLEYDGARWRFYRLPEGQIIRTVAWHDGRVFVGGFAEFGYFERNPESKWRYNSLSSSLQSAKVSREEIWHILVSPTKKAVYFQSFSNIYKYDGQKTTEIAPPANIMFFQEAYQRIYFQGIGHGIFELMDGGGFRFYDGSLSLANSIVSFILPGTNGSLLIGTNNDGLFECSGGNCQPWQNPMNELLKSLQPNKALRLRNAGLAIGTILGGVFILDAQGRLQYHLDMESGLQNNTVLSMKSDQAGNLWLALDKGIDLIELNSPLTWFSDFSGKLGTVYSAALHNGHLFLGTNQGVFSKEWNKGRDSLDVQGLRDRANIGFRLVPGTQGQVWQLVEFDGQLLCGHNEGTFLIESSTASKISGVTGGWTTLAIPGREDVLLQGTYTGLVIFKKTENGKWTFSHRVQGYSDSAKKLAFDESGYLWIAHPSRGLWRLRLNDRLDGISEIKRYTADDGLMTDFRLNLINSGSGLLVKADSIVLKVNKGHLVPLASGETKATLFDFGTEGTFSIDPLKVIYSRQGHSLTLPVSLVPGYENIIQAGEGEFLFCLENGYAYWDLKTATSTDSSFHNKLRISAIEVLTDPLRWHFPEPGAIPWELPSTSNNLRLYFSQPDFTRKSTFRWTLSGALQRSAFAEQDFIELTNLKPGEYKLEVSAGEAPFVATFEFEILPPWWQSWWASLIWMFLLAGLLFLIEKYNKMRLEKQRDVLEKEKLRELEAQRNKGEKERLQVVLKNKNRELSNATINLIRKNETLLELKSELENTNLDKKEGNRLNRMIENHLSADQDWQMFEEAFNQVHDEFFKKLKAQYKDLTPGDLRLAAFLKLNLSTKEISSLLGLSVRGVENKRYRLRKKIGLGEDDNLTEFMMQV